MKKNKAPITITDVFSLTQDTGIKKPTLPWNRADAKQDAAGIAYNTILRNREPLSELGINRPAAAVFIADNQNYAFSIYDREKEKPKSENGQKIVLNVEPFYLGK